MHFLTRLRGNNLGINAVILALIITGCNGDDDSDDTSLTADGAVFTESNSGVTETIASIQTFLSANDAVSEVALVNHQQNAENANLNLRATQLILFGNPALGTPLMQENPLVGLDLPQKMLAFEDDRGRVFLTYNGTQYLAARHDLSGVDETLLTMSNALKNIASNATVNTVDDSANAEVNVDEGIEKMVSQQDFASTYASLKMAIQAAGPVSIMAELDHQANAQSVNLTLQPIRLIVFGNPVLGTPLMQKSQSIGLDLPQKMLVFQQGEDVIVAYNDPAYLARRHGIAGETEILTQISAALENFAMMATTPAARR